MRQPAVFATMMVISAGTAFAQFVGPGATIPAVANQPGRNETLWRSDVTVLNINATDTSVVLLLQPELIDGQPAFAPRVSDPLQVPAATQLTMTNVLQSQFGLINTMGALSVFTLDGKPVVVSSRTYTLAEGGGTFGQDVRGALVANTAWVSGLRQDSLYRTNLGVFMPVDPVPSAVVSVRIFKADGTEVGSGSLLFPSAGVQQVGLPAFGVSNLLDGYAVITCSDPSLAWYGYVSRVDQVTGDAVYRAAIGRQSDLP